jgi:hypothetical protein
MKLLELLELLKIVFLSAGNNYVTQKINLQKLVILGKVWHFAPPIPFFIGPKKYHRFPKLRRRNSWKTSQAEAFPTASRGVMLDEGFREPGRARSGSYFERLTTSRQGDPKVQIVLMRGAGIEPAQPFQAEGF